MQVEKSLLVRLQDFLTSFSIFLFLPAREFLLISSGGTREIGGTAKETSGEEALDMFLIMAIVLAAEFLQSLRGS